jgi:hypothetical protein
MSARNSTSPSTGSRRSTSPSPATNSARRLSAPRRIQSPRRKTNFFHSLQSDSTIDSWTAIAQKTQDKTIDTDDVEATVSAGIRGNLRNLLQEIDDTDWMFNDKSLA